MRPFFVILGHELRMLLVSPASYFMAAVFVVLMAFLYWLAIIEAARNSTLHVTSQFFRGFFIPTLFMVPLITMRSLAEERRMGTLETLMTTPVTASHAVLAKYLSAWLYYMALWLLTLAFPSLITSDDTVLAGQEMLYEAAPLAGGLLYVATSGLTFIALGLFFSALTRNQLLAGVLSFFTLFIVIIIPLFLEKFVVTEMGEQLWLLQFIEVVQPFEHLEDFCRGVIDTRPFTYYLSSAIIFLGLTSLVVEAKS